MAAMQTFVPVAEPPSAQPQTLLRRGSQVSEGAAVAPSNLATSAATAVSFGALALVAGKTFAGTQRKRRGIALVRCAEEKPFAGGLIGGESAFASGYYNFDPLGLSIRCEKYLPWFRESELKHGRVCMLAWVGLVVPEAVRIPGPESCYSASVVDAHYACVHQASKRMSYGQEVQDLAGPLFQVFLFCGFIEMMTTFPKVLKIGEEGLNLENAGNYQLGVNFLPSDEAKAKEMKLKELKNGRLAMLAFGGAVTQAVLTGNGFPWLYATREGNCTAGLGASIQAAKAPRSIIRGLVARRAEGYKMSKSVPFLPVSPALDGYAGEEDGFDPLGVSLAIDIRWLRESELKHGRVCMLAVVGWITTDLGYRVPGGPFQVSTIDAHDAMVKFGNMPQMLCWLGYAEFFGFLAIISMMEGKTDRQPGDFGIRLLYPTDEKSQYEMQMKELRNGRLAMLAFSGIVTSAVLTGKTWPFFATADARPSASGFGSGSALCGGLQGTRTRAGVAAYAEASASLPFMPKPKNLDGLVGAEQEFDPLGLCETFDPKWLRESEIKHGRVCMLACLGFAGQQYVLFPGIPETPNSLDAFYSAPAPLWATLIFAAGFIESSSYGGKITMLDMFEDKDKVPGDFRFGSGFLNGKSDQEVYDMKLKELNNGRLAMMAIGGMVHHNLVVKGPLFPLFPANWAGPQYTWDLNSVAGTFAFDLVGGQGNFGGLD